jgi:hypothetical protein
MPAVSGGDALTEARIPAPPARTGLHRPWRALVALAELIGAGVAVWGAFACWDRGISPVVLVLSDGTRLESVRHHGGWLALAILLGTTAAVLVLDAIRQVVLAVRARPRPPLPKHATASS